MKDLKIKYNETFGTKRSRDYYRGLSFHFSGKWLVGVHYFSDDYVIDFVTINNCLLACAKSHLSLEENKPTEFIVDDKGDITGVASQYWDFVCAGLHGDPIEIRYNEETGELEVRTSVSDWIPIVKIPQALQELGNSEKDTISQKVITEELATKLDIDDAVFEKGTGTNSAQQKNCGNDARGSRSFAHGDHNMAMEGGAHAEGSYTVANAIGSHTEGQSTLATNQFEHAEGKFNKSNNGTLHSVGIGANAQHRTNAFEIMQNGDAYLKGVGNYDGTNPSSATPINELIGKSDVFWCTYSSTGQGTTAQEVSDAISAGKIVAVTYNGRTYILTNNGSTTFDFSALVGTSQGVCSLKKSDDKWSSYVVTLQRETNKVTSWQSTPDDTHYPSEKLVKDTIDTALGNIETLLAAI